MARRRTKKRRSANLKRRRNTGARHVARKRKKERKYSARSRRHARLRRKLGGKPQQKAKYLWGSYSTGTNLCVPNDANGVKRLFDEAERRNEPFGLPLAMWSSVSPVDPDRGRTLSQSMDKWFGR